MLIGEGLIVPYFEKRGPKLLLRKDECSAQTRIEETPAGQGMLEGNVYIQRHWLISLARIADLVYTQVIFQFRFTAAEAKEYGED